MTCDLICAEIGSTTTVVSAFSGLDGDRPRCIGQGQAATTVERGDVRIGLEQALEELRRVLFASKLTWGRFYAASSAAGGLQMSVHGLVRDMTVKAAREAALGAGANICQITAGRLREADLRHLASHRPGIIFLAGGLEYGERETALYNAERIKDLFLQEGISIPVLYAGNSANHDEIREIFQSELHICENVYPDVDHLVCEPARRAIQKIFERHITQAPGMEGISSLVDGPIMPVPGAVMRAAQLLHGSIGNLILFDVGGATSDLHSVCVDAPENRGLHLAPEPKAKRTVEGDLGVYLNRAVILQRYGREEIASRLSVSPEELEELSRSMAPLPQSDREREYVSVLCHCASSAALYRHTGRWRRSFAGGGSKRLIQGKDLSAVSTVIGTGGPLCRLPEGKEILRRVLEEADPESLSPPPDSRILIDHGYILSCAGLLAEQDPDAALALLHSTLS